MSESTRDRLITVRAAWGGPAVEVWLRSLTPVCDRPAALQRLAGAGEIHEAYRDRDGRHVVVLPGPEMRAEWPRDPAVAATWTDQTVLASAARPRVPVPCSRSPRSRTAPCGPTRSRPPGTTAGRGRSSSATTPALSST
ncbi:hypothetical protein M1L60_19905 [Actinoplanes sp. TRM 88003]|uniref:Uncharacterized protein n=1 Tax=Paractinoplanes aksuensis TaxID=2939490 RepID=A0ABT1DQU3_9ACTN|nr:hypothetical protein [Actinoplanes aksuensis]MCO8272863.1 hypothetical protein [Actinoplanes aksuensis]